MYEIPGFSFTRNAGADLTSSQFRFLNLNGSGKVVLASNGGRVIGALNNKPDDTEAATVVHNGVVMIEASAAIAQGADVQSASNGKAVTLTSGSRAGIALEAAADDGSIIPVLLMLDSPVPATNVVGDQSAVVHLTNSTGVTGDDTIENVPAATAAVTDTTAASLTSTNTALTALENNVADLAVKVNAILTKLESAGLLSS